MKTIRHYLRTLDLSKLEDDFQTYISIEEVALDFGIYDAADISQDDENIRLKTLDHPELTWICTDTTVGVSFIFLDKLFVGISIQMARKDDIHYYWYDKESYDMVSDYIHSLVKKRETNPTFINWEQDMEPFELKKKEMDQWNKEWFEKHVKPNLKK